MAISVAIHRTDAAENGKTVYASVTFDASYPTGGEILAASDFGLRGISSVTAGGADDATYHATYVRSTGGLKLFVEDGTTGIEAEAANASDQSAVVVPVIVTGVA